MKVRGKILLSLALLLLVLPLVVSPTPALADPIISLDPTSGPPGTVIGISGSGFTSSTLTSIWFDIDGDSARDTGEPYKFTQTTANGEIPSGINLIAPEEDPDDYQVLVGYGMFPSSTEASATFTITSITISLAPDFGPAGTEITITGSNFDPSTAGYIWFDINGDTVMDGGEPQTAVTTTGDGEILTDTTLTAPQVAMGTYPVQADIPDGDSSIEASANFEIIDVPMILLDPDSGVTGTEITVTGSNFDPSTTGYIWFDINGDTVMDGGEPQTAVTTTGDGEIPADTTLNAPQVTMGTYPVQADIPDGDSSIEASADFTKTSNTTLWVTVTKYDAYGDIISSPQTITWEEMMTTMDIYGDGTTHYYCHGPTFSDDASEPPGEYPYDNDFDCLWDPLEWVNIDSRDYGAAMGTDVKDLCELAGGASPGDVIKIASPDGFSKSFDYEDVYDPEPEQGRIVLCWYTDGTAEGFGGFVPDYDTGMRLLFFAETLNPEGKHVFGIWDMHETMSPSRWHYYADAKLWPSSSGLSVKWVSDIKIYQPNLISCDEYGTPKDSFEIGETVYVKGLGLEAETYYNFWVQDDPVLNSPLNDLDRPSGDDYELADDPSLTQETIETDGNGDFTPVAVWENIDLPIGEYDYDIVADNQDSGTVGIYDDDDEIDCSGVSGFSVTSAEHISFTVTTYDENGIVFGNLDPGQTGPAAYGGGAGAVTITVGSETNVDVDIQIKGDNFSGPDTIAIGNVKYDSDADPDGASTMTDTYVTWYQVGAGTYDERQGYHWITIPAEQTAGDYTSTFYYQAIKSE